MKNLPLVSFASVFQDISECTVILQMVL